MNGNNYPNPLDKYDSCLTKSPLLQRPITERTFDDYREDKRNIQHPTESAECSSTHEQLEVEFSNDFDYWDRFGPPDKIMKALVEFNVKSIKSIKYGKSYLTARPNDPIFGYVLSPECIKTYAPKKPKNNGKFIFFGKKPENHVDILGLNQLPPKGGMLFIVESFKDCITANANGLLSIGVDNAGTKVPHQIIADLKNRFKIIIVMYDNDDAGIKGSAKFAQEHGLLNLQLPKWDNCKKTDKDISDYLEAGLSVKHIVELAHELHSNHLKQIENGKCKSLETENNKSDCVEQNKNFPLPTPIIPESCYKNVAQILKNASCSTVDDLGRDPIVPTESEKSMIDTLENMISKAASEPKKQFLWSGIKVGSVGFVFGPPKSGKTIFCENLALALATGADSFFMLPIESGCEKVLFISMEEYWQNRTERNILQLEFLKRSLNGKLISVTEEFPRQIVSVEGWEQLEKIITDSGSDVVFIDSLNRLYIGSIEDSSLAKEIMFKIRELANSLKITLIIIHHTPKQCGRPLSINSVAGSRILGQEADFMIGINKTSDGVRYMKEVAFRYKAENDENVTSFIINEYACITPSGSFSESALLKETNDGRIDHSNTDIVLEIIKKKTATPQGYASTKDLMEACVNSGIMSKPTLYNQLRNLQAKNIIYCPKKGRYQVKGQ